MTPAPDEIAEQIATGREHFADGFDFELDDWQLQAGGVVVQGHNIIVCAPTGAGKTVVGEMALRYAFYENTDTDGIYTTPLKALSNQKYTDLCQTFGRKETGLSTGDISINNRARVRVMTTEVYRNIAWRASTPGVSDVMENKEEHRDTVVVLDEFHYMGQPGRGGVWEECVITSPSESTQIIGLSATLSNGAELCAWMEAATSRPTVLINVPASMRPVPLRFLFATKDGLFPLFRDPDAGPGAPNGLLGYRGDGIRSQERKVPFVKSGFGASAEKMSRQQQAVEKLPKGLQVNPALKATAAKRLKKVKQSLEKLKVRRRIDRHGKRSGRERDGDFDEMFSDGRQRRLSPREERREEERLVRKEMRRAVPSLHGLVSRLRQKDLLPAIFFLFSRAGCEDAAQSLYSRMKGFDNDRLDDIFDDNFGSNQRQNRQPKPPKLRTSRSRASKKLIRDEDGRSYRRSSSLLNENLISTMYDADVSSFDTDTLATSSPLSSKNLQYCAKAGLLTYEQVCEVASRISLFNTANEEIAFEEHAIEQYLFGVGAHHAGMLPAHKSFVELLYQKQLMRVVVATETLAAGINMPARTTVVLSMAKRGNGSSMSLLETSNLLQMAGRAGRRGMDTDGTCVVAATPFESHEEAATILTDPIKPISSQFRPSYSLAVNLVSRGHGKLDVAKTLVGQSFAWWQQNHPRLDGTEEALDSVETSFVTELASLVEFQIIQRRKGQDAVEELELLLSILKDSRTLKKTSKDFIASNKMLELEEVTLQYLEAEHVGTLKESTQDDQLLEAMAKEDRINLSTAVNEQGERVLKMQNDVAGNPLNKIVVLANDLLCDTSPRSTSLRSALRVTRKAGLDGNLTVFELAEYTKDAASTKIRPQGSHVSGHGSGEESEPTSWDAMLSIVQTLVAFGCLEPLSGSSSIQHSSLEEQEFKVTQAGFNVGMLAFDNSLWCLCALGGAWDVLGLSTSPGSWKKDREDETHDDEATICQKENDSLVETLLSLPPHEFAGYVSCISGDGSRSLNNAFETFQNLSLKQQLAIEKSLNMQSRLLDVQHKFSKSAVTQDCPFDLSNCEVVTAWAQGCSWNEAVEISGSPPGDLVRTLTRVLDTLRQLGNLPFSPLRRNDSFGNKQTAPEGIHPEIRRMCRQCAVELNRYPVKDPLTFAAEEQDFDAISDESEELESDNQEQEN